MVIDFIKCHGTGNDFVLIDEMKRDYGFTEEQRRSLAIEMCSRTGPVGADGILFVQRSSNADGRMRIFNADGTEPEMCGNGLRCVGRYVLDHTGKDTVEIETMKARYMVKSYSDIYPGVRTVEILIDTVSFEPESLPMVHDGKRFMFGRIKEFSDNLEFSAVSITNPHLISIVDEIRTEELVNIGRLGNSTPHIFPRGVNVSFVKILNRESIYVKTFERGVGLTKSCGTGMTASSVVACMYDRDRFGKEINIFNDGGMIKCIVNANDIEGYKVRFIGNATFVYNGSFNTEGPDVKPVFNHEPYMVETRSYDKFFEYTQEVINS